MTDDDRFFATIGKGMTVVAAVRADERQCLNERLRAERAIVRRDERAHPKASVDEIKCLRMMLDHAERWIDFRWLGEWGQHGIAKAFVERLAAIDERERT